MSAWLDALIARVGVDHVTIDDDPRYRTDESYTWSAQPSAVVRPASVADVIAVVEICGSANVPIVPRGAGTGVAGGAVALSGGVVVSTERMQAIREIDAVNRFATVEAGVVNASLGARAAAVGLRFAPDPSSFETCTIGGNAATNASGAFGLRYGATSRHVLGLELVGSDARARWLGGPADTTGYDLRGVTVGSEGTLGLVTALVVRLVPLPGGVATAVITFASLHAAMTCVARVKASGIALAALELLDDRAIAAIRAAGIQSYAAAATAVLLVEVERLDERVATRAIERVGGLCLAEGALEVGVASSALEREQLWRGRRLVGRAMARLSPRWFLQDVSLPPSRLVAITAQITEIARTERVSIANVIHAGDGNLHPLVCYDPADSDELARARRATEAIVRSTLSLGGSVSGEHGIGADKREWMREEYAPADLDAMARVRHAFDATGLMNPGKLLPSGSACRETLVHR